MVNKRKKERALFYMIHFQISRGSRACPGVLQLQLPVKTEAYSRIQDDATICIKQIVGNKGEEEQFFKSKSLQSNY